MKKRQKLAKKQSKRLFTATAGNNGAHPKNFLGAPMRGGIRL